MPSNDTAPLLIDADACAALCGCGRSLWYSLLAAGKIGPQSVRLGRKRLWRRQEVESWIAANCPDSAMWQAMTASAGRRLKTG